VIAPDDRPASYIPKKPQPSLVDLLLPPGKPIPPTDILGPTSWPCMTGAAVCRILHRYKRLRNEVDDSLRQIRELPRLTVKERRLRESLSTQRCLAEFATKDGDSDPSEHAVDHLCKGGDYNDLSPVQRLCMLRLLIDAAYDTVRLYQVIDSNHKQRTNAVKALDTEQRKAKREAREKAASDEAAARQDLASETRQNFIEEKRDEIRKANEANHELTEAEIEELTDEDILDFDDDIKADYEALPAPERFKKAEVLERVSKLQEAKAFETEMLTVLTMKEVVEKEVETTMKLQEGLQELGGEEALLDPSLDRQTLRSIEKLRRELTKIETTSDTLPGERDAAIDGLKEAIADGTIKSLRAAIRVAKSARLFGPDDETNGVWALDVVRDAHMELENAKHNKRVADAQKDLVNKLNRCFIRTEPLGSDRYRNCLWRFGSSEASHVWAEVSPVLSQEGTKLQNEEGFLPLVADASRVTVGGRDVEEDFVPKSQIEDLGAFTRFSRREYHGSGLEPSLVQRHWGCHASESSVRALLKGLDGRGIRENELKKSLKEALEENAVSTHDVLPNENSPKALSVNQDVEERGGEEEDSPSNSCHKDGDEIHFEEAVKNALESKLEGLAIDGVFLGRLTSAIGQKVRVRTVIESSRDHEVARYEVGSIAGWKILKEEWKEEALSAELEPTMKMIDKPYWKVSTEKGTEVWLTGFKVVESICRFVTWKSGDKKYFEPDATFLAYRNALGRHCGRAADAAHAMTPIRFAQSMAKRETELYQRLKHYAVEDEWGGRNGNRNAWITSMKDYAFDFETAREGLFTLENALFEMMGGETTLQATEGDSVVDAKDLLENPLTRDDIELESIDKGVKGLWSTRASRAVFLEIMKSEFLSKLSIYCQLIF